jgi:predicted ester cyclase
LAEAVNTGNLDAVDYIFAAGYVRLDPSDLLREAGVEEYKRTFTRLRAAFPDAHWNLGEILEDEDKVIGRSTFQGTQPGLFFNIPPSGSKVTYPIIAIYRIEDGRIVEDWHVFHALGLWQMLIPEIRDLLNRARNP